MPSTNSYAAGLQQLDRREAVARADVLPARDEPLRGVGTGQRAERDEDRRRRLPAQQQESRERRREHQADQHGERQGAPDLAELQVAADQRDDVAGHAEEQRLAEAHDPRVAPAQVEADRQHREDQDVGDQRDQLGAAGQRERRHQHHPERHEFDDRQHAGGPCVPVPGLLSKGRSQASSVSGHRRPSA